MESVSLIAAEAGEEVVNPVLPDVPRSSGAPSSSSPCAHPHAHGVALPPIREGTGEAGRKGPRRRGGRGEGEGRGRRGTSRLRRDPGRGPGRGGSDRRGRPPTADARRAEIVGAAETELTEARTAALADVDRPAQCRSGVVAGSGGRHRGVGRVEGGRTTGRPRRRRGRCRPGARRRAGKLRNDVDTLMMLASEGPNGFWLPADKLEVLWGTLAFLVVFLLSVEVRLSGDHARPWPARSERIGREPRRGRRGADVGRGRARRHQERPGRQRHRGGPNRRRGSRHRRDPHRRRHGPGRGRRRGHPGTYPRRGRRPSRGRPRPTSAARCPVCPWPPPRRSSRPASTTPPTRP